MESNSQPGTSPSGAGDRSRRDMDEFWREARPRREPIRTWWFLPAVFLALAVSVPWYWPAGSIGRIILGLPVWVWVTVGGSIVVAALTALASLRLWEDDDFESESGDEE